MIRQIWCHVIDIILKKNRPQKTKEAQNVAFNLKGIEFLYYFTVSNIYTDNLKLI
jgi:hypothetical protein